MKIKDTYMSFKLNKYLIFELTTQCFCFRGQRSTQWNKGNQISTKEKIDYEYRIKLLVM